MTFEEYCLNKKIDPKAFASGDPDKWNELKNLFDQVHPNSFTQQKKFLINNLRHTYILKESAADVSSESKKATPKPIIKKPALSVKPGTTSTAPKIPKPVSPKRP